MKKTWQEIYISTILMHSLFKEKFKNLLLNEQLQKTDLQIATVNASGKSTVELNLFLEVKNSSWFCKTCPKMISNLSLHIYAQMKDIFLPVAARDDGGMLGRDPPPLVPWLPFM